MSKKDTTSYFLKGAAIFYYVGVLIIKGKNTWGIVYLIPTFKNNERNIWFVFVETLYESNGMPVYDQDRNIYFSKHV